MRFLIVAAALLIGGCAQAPSGNSLGGTIDWFGMDARTAQRMADKHCGQYGKQAHIKSIIPRAGGHVIFECIA